MRDSVGLRRKARASRLVTAWVSGVALCALLAPASALAQEEVRPDDAADDNAIVVTGIRSSLQSALTEKRNADNLIEVIQAEDIGKLPDQNLAEVLENITGVQITREAGVGTGVQIRGTNDNRVEINGVSTVGSGSGRGGISFEDVSASIIASVEVTKAPEAKTIEGSVGGTINLRTIRPLDLKEMLLAARVQGEHSELSKSVRPRISATFGDKWSTGIGEIGLVVSGSYTQQEATSFRPRVDRDGGLVENVNATVVRSGVAENQPTRRPAAQDFDFVGIQFLNQELENFEYETKNFAGTLEWAPSDHVKFYFDTIYNDQQRRQDSSRVQGSGVNALLDYSVPTSFQTVDFGSLDGVKLGSIRVAETGTIEPNIAVDRDDPNLRFSSDVGARLTKSEIYRLGTEFDAGRLTGRVEASRSISNTRNPDLSTTLNFLNPNAPVFTGNDNAVPFIYDLSGGSLAFGINFDSPFAPTVEQLLDPANVVLQQVSIGNDSTRNKEDAARIDLSLDVADLTPFFTSFDVGYRFNRSSSTFNDVGSTLTLSSLNDSPRGTLFADLLVRGPNNFGDADGRTLFFKDFLLVDPNRAFSDREGTLDILRAALLAAPGQRALNDASANSAGYFSINETTNAVYGQANFEIGPVRGNFGLRWLDTSLDSIGNSITGANVTQVVTRGGYNKLLPRLNLVADVADNILLRASWGRDINRPDFDLLSTSVSFVTSENAAVSIGNPNLRPETVTSYDASIDWYFAPSSVLSVGVFHKKRTDLFVTQLEDAPLDANGYRDITAPCEGGGIYNPIAFRNQLSPIGGSGMCVPILTTINDSGSTTQTGVEVALQYDLSQFEDTLGFASGFGIVANYTYQKFGGGQAVNSSATRGTDIFNAINGIYDDADFVPVTAKQGLLDFSKHAYNLTLYYEKYGLSARARYTWRSAFRTLDTVGGATLASTFGIPVVTAARGQLNASISYDINSFLSVGVEGVNLSKSKISQYCVNDGALLCFEGLPDRRITFGASVRF
ncbi:TonB-dependent receptor [Sphingopyxis terrae subsp. ummariensis]|uniref:TonB-dependent receptor n=2 Tax=Sphingopyxis terrae TaxID=33052 RepID=A0A1Y6FPB7_9SPHN|nr:TonB-dependent receptor [Sphingopyxis terrae subsp. ummariensis]SMQ76577.1 TonB-dependent receptor [Sphingopyxis terrae subsp. ummariensis]